MYKIMCGFVVIEWGVVVLFAGNGTISVVYIYVVILLGLAAGG